MSSLRSLRQLTEREIAGGIFGDQIISATTAEGRKELKKKMLLRDLVMLGINPFRAKDVGHYKAARMRFHDVLGDVGLVVGDFFNTSDAPERVTKIAVGTALSAGFIALMLTSSLSAAFWTSVLAGIVSLFAIIGVAAAAERFYGRFYNSRWNTSLFDYFVEQNMQPAIPVDVLALADRIRAARPDVRLEVDWFMQDPFLVVVHPEHADMRFFVAVWDEKNFRTANHR